MTEWPAYKMARDLANGKVFPVSETVIMQTACKHEIGPDGEAVAGGLKQSARLDFVLERLALDLGAFQHGVGIIDAWAKGQADRPDRPEAIRRLIERGLVAEPSAPRPRSKGAPKAAEMASHEINKLGDKSATDEERATRKRRLISGPKEFRGTRRK